MYQKYKILLYHFALILFVFIAILIRLHTQFSQELIPGINGGYYPLLARNILESGRMNYPDAPLIHYFNAFVAKLISLITGKTTDASVLLAVRLTDSLIPPLVILPLLGFARRLGKNNNNSWSAMLIASFGSLYLIPLMVMTGDLTKNAVGMVFLAFFMERSVRWQTGRSRLAAAQALLFLILTALTHIGSLAVAFLFLIVAGLFSLPSEKKQRIRGAITFFGMVLLFAVATFFLLRQDPARLERVFSLYLNPLRIFESPILFVFLEGQLPFSSFLLHNFIIINTLSTAGLILLILWNRQTGNEAGKAAWIFTITALALSSPLIGIEWAQRYHMMAWLPIAFQYLSLFFLIQNRIVKNSIVGAFGFLLIFSVVAGLTGQRKSSITPGAFRDLANIRKAVGLGEKDLIVARHGLEWWIGWTLHVKTGKEYCLKPGDWGTYRSIYLLRQKKGNNFPANPGTNQFAELPDPSEPQIVYSSDYFNLIRLREPGAADFSPGILPLIQGRIVSIETNLLIIKSQDLNIRIMFGPETRFAGCDRNSLAEGQRADIWGKRRPFSTKIHANIIRAY